MALLHPNAPNFPAEEFAAASRRELTAEEWAKAAEWALWLQPARDELGPILVTSFVRSWGSWAHHGGDAVDLDAGSEADNWRLFLWLADHYGPAPGRPAQFGELIFERTHVHLTRPGIGGDGEILVEPKEKEYRLWTGARSMRIALGAGLGVLALLIAAAVLRGWSTGTV